MSTQNLMQSGDAAANAQAFRDGMSKVMAAVHIITVRTPHELLGTTATAVCSVSDSPPTLLVCLHRQGRVGNAIEPGYALTVNTLAEGHDHLANIFAGAGKLDMAQRFEHGQWNLADDMAPTLRDSVVSFQTEVDKVIQASSHIVILCRVKAITHPAPEAAAPSAALLYGARNYRTVALDSV